MTSFVTLTFKIHIRSAQRPLVVIDVSETEITNLFAKKSY